MFDDDWPVLVSFCSISSEPPLRRACRHQQSHLGRPAPKAGTLGGLLASYRASRSFLDLQADTRSQYERMIEKGRPLFDMPLVNVTRSFISKLNDKLVEKHGHRTSGYVLSILSVAFEHGIERELVASNPVKGVARPRKPTRDPEDIADEAAKPHQVEDEE